MIRCRRFDEMLAFWQAALGYVQQAPPDDGWVILNDPTGRGPHISLDQVDQPPPLGEGGSRASRTLSSCGLSVSREERSDVGHGARWGASSSPDG